jgi:hypothetical protein
VSEYPSTIRTSKDEKISQELKEDNDYIFTRLRSVKLDADKGNYCRVGGFICDKKSCSYIHIS